jgi:hypothetical protein
MTFIQELLDCAPCCNQPRCNPTAAKTGAKARKLKKTHSKRVRDDEDEAAEGGALQYATTAQPGRVTRQTTARNRLARAASQPEASAADAPTGDRRSDGQYNLSNSLDSD